MVCIHAVLLIFLSYSYAKHVSVQAPSFKHSRHMVPYHTVSYFGTPYHTMPYHTVPYHTIPYHTIPYHTIPYHTIPYHTVQYHTIPYHTIPYHTIPYHTMAQHVRIDLQRHAWPLVNYLRVIRIQSCQCSYLCGWRSVSVHVSLHTLEY